MSRAQDRLFEIQEELDRRNREMLRLYRPSPQQEEAHRCGAPELLLSGGKRCISGDTEIYDPVTREYKRVDQIDGEFHVYSRRLHDGACIVTRASRPFTKGEGQFYQIELSNGESFTATAEHRVLGVDGWVSVAQLLASFQTLVGPRKWRSRQVINVTPVDGGTVWDFEVPETGNYYLAGIVHSNSGKSVSASVEFAARVTGQNIIASDGTEIPNPWPKPTPNSPRLYWIIGYETRHIGETIHRLLFEPGQGGSYRAIKDLKTGKWRAWNRANAEDVARVEESKLSEPLISSRFIDGDDSWSWEDKKARQFNTVVLNNGATIRAYPSSGVNPKQGDAVSGIWIDEDIKFPHHLKEWQDRLTDMEGWFLWSVWPHTKNDALLNLIDRADLTVMDENPQIRKYQLIMTDNPYLSDKGKAQSLGRMESEEEIARRNRGDTLVHELNMYNYVSEIHEIKRPKPGRAVGILPKAHEALRDIWMTRGQFPNDWTRYLSIDPSNTRTAVHSWVVPPREYLGTFFGNVAIGEWEVIARKYSAPMLAKTLAEKMSTRNYEAFIMDFRAGRQTHAGHDLNTMNVYAKAFREAGLFSRQTSFSFAQGCDIPNVRQNAVRELLREDPESGIPKLMFVEETTGETKVEFTRYRRRKETRGEGFDTLLDEPANPRLFDAMQSMEYFAAYIEISFSINTAYVHPSNYQPRGSGAYRYIQAEMAKQEKQASGNVVYLGAGDYTSGVPGW